MLTTSTNAGLFESLWKHMAQQMHCKDTTQGQDWIHTLLPGVYTSGFFENTLFYEKFKEQCHEPLLICSLSKCLTCPMATILCTLVWTVAFHFQ